jgi:hypothetical protein
MISLLFVVSGILHAGTGTTYDFLKNDVSARAASLGGSFVTMPDDPNAMYYNPAMLSTLNRTSLSVGFFKHFLDVNAGYATFGMHMENGLGYLGAGILYVNYGEFNRTGDEGQNLGVFGAGDLAVSVALADRLGEVFSYGISLKFIYSSLAEVSSSAAGIDAGVSYVVTPERLVLGASLTNLGTQFDPYLDTREDLPLGLRIGASVYPEHLPAALVFSFNDLIEHGTSFSRRLRNFAVGAEFIASESVRLRVGYNNQRRQDSKLGTSTGLGGLSFGAGFLIDDYTVDYAFNSFGALGGLHRISLGIAL